MPEQHDAGSPTPLSTGEGEGRMQTVWGSKANDVQANEWAWRHFEGQSLLCPQNKGLQITLFGGPEE